jgi:hypothetical protein
MKNLNDILDLSFCQVLKYLRRETARLYTKALLVWSLGMAVANIAVR